MLLTQGNNHVFVCGLTQSGKSHFSHRAMLELNSPVLYFNIQGEKIPKGFITVYSNEVGIDQLIELLKDNLKINLVFQDFRKGYNITAGYILSQLIDAGFSDVHPMYVGIDECHLLTGYSLDMAKVIATAGLKKGVRCIFITQRPANCDKTLYTQSFEHYLFYLPKAEESYMKAKGIDFDYCKGEWEHLGKHSYCYYNGYVLEGRSAL